MQKFRFTIVVAIISVITMSFATGCGQVSTSQNKESVEGDTGEVKEISEETLDVDEESDIYIMYTNDVHSYIDNVIKDEDQNIVGDGLRFSKIAAMVNDMKEAGKNVLLVDAGDEIQGDIYGAMDEGESIIKLMKATGYQLATPGNHDFDYGVIQLLKLAETAGFPYVTSNFHSTKSKEIIFTDSYTFDIGGKRVAFVGVSTPETFSSSTPTYFQDENGEFIYTIDGLNDKKDLYESVQNAIDKVKTDADYVICIGHLGVGMDSKAKGWDSISVIENVSGINAFIDGHSHTKMPGDIIKDKDGNEVILTQTGSYLNAVGMMKIASDGHITTELVEEYDREDETVAELEDEWINEVNEMLGEKIGTLENPMYINNPDNDKQRWIRSSELNLGDFVADSTYWFFNERLEIDCDVVLVNGGGIRAQIDEGDLTYISAKQVEPFGNMICLISATGQQIIDALEKGATVVGEWDDELDSPAENGGFMQAAGLKYSVDTSVESRVLLDNNGMFEKVDGDYRVKNVEIYNKELGKYEPINPDQTYQLGGSNYILRNSGDGLSMFDSSKLTVDYVGQDYVILSEYIKNFDEDGTVNNKNCPLSKYDGYLLDYENPLGSGRINIIVE